MEKKAFQDYYPDYFSHCYGCGRLNEQGMQIKSYWDGEETVCIHIPKSYYTGGAPGYAYGGLIASLIDATPWARLQQPNTGRKAGKWALSPPYVL